MSINKIIYLKCKNRYETDVYVHESEMVFNRVFRAAHRERLHKWFRRSLSC
jgi:hypothetical protein